MDPLFWNKVFGAILGTVFVVLSLTFLSEGIFHNDVPEQAGYEIAVAETSGGSGEDAKADGPAYEDISPMLASADIAAGEKVAKKCAACHIFEKGGKNKVGPHLYDLVNREMGSVGDFSYSKALKAYGDGKTWDYSELNGFLFKPKTHIKGTTMGFAGLKKTADRANLVGWLRTLSDNPAELPQ